MFSTQGGVLSPALFCVRMYIDALLQRLARSMIKIGCNFATVFVSVLAYIDVKNV